MGGVARREWETLSRHLGDGALRHGWDTVASWMSSVLRSWLWALDAAGMC